MIMFDFLKSIPTTIVLAIVALLLFALPGLNSLVEYETQGGPLLQLPQLFGCHLLHWSREHVFWDLGMFVVLGALCERINRKAYWYMLLISAALIPPLVGWCYPAIEVYRGLSGIDTALFGMATICLGLQRWREKDQQGVFLFAALLLGMLFKIGHEMVAGNTFFVESANFVPVPIAHLVGAAIGISIAVLYELGCWNGPGFLDYNSGSAKLHSCQTSQ